MLVAFLRVLCAVVVSLAALLVHPGSAAGAIDPPAVQVAADEAEEVPAKRILLYGDSLTMGFAGDWTWRYRLWRSLTASGTAFDFVGPRTDMLGYVSRRQFSQAYRDPEFDRDHASYGGMTFSKPLWEVAALTNYYQPDVVVGQIGMNDLFKGLRTSAQVMDMWRTQITKVRVLRPQTSFVLVQLPQTWWYAVRVYNAGLASVARELDLPQSRVVTAVNPRWEPYKDTYDQVHPSAAGERKMGDSVATALASIGVGGGPVHGLVDPESSVVWAPTPVAQVVSGTLTVSWPAVDYAYKEDVYVVDVTGGPPIGDPLARARVTGTTWSMPAQAGHTYEVWLAPVKGYLPMGTRSATVTVEAPVAASLP